MESVMTISRRHFGTYLGSGLAGIIASGGKAQAAGHRRGLCTRSRPATSADSTRRSPGFPRRRRSSPSCTRASSPIRPERCLPISSPRSRERWTVSPDGKLYEFSLRKGVKWHENIGEFTSDDVKFSLDRYRDAAVSPWSKAYANVDAVAGRRQVYGAHRTEERRSVLPCKRCRRHRIDRAPSVQDGFRDSAAPIRCGCTQSGPALSASRNTCRATASLWCASTITGRASPRLDELVIRFMPSSASRELAMRTSEIDSMRGALDAQLLDRMEKQGFVLDKKGPETVWYLHINTSVKPLDDIRVRKAIAHAINPADLRTFLGPVATISERADPAHPISVPQRPRNCRPTQPGAMTRPRPSSCLPKRATAPASTSA